MSTVDEYFSGLDAPAREAFERIRALAMELAPEAEDGMSYGMAALRCGGKPLLGFRAAKGHLSIFPFSPQAVDAVRGRLSDDDLSKGTIRFRVSEPLSDDVVRDVIRHRLTEIAGS
jgi:uncharacterized protein YdhG (YjbR/CyaY superfamily)